MRPLVIARMYRYITAMTRRKPEAKLQKGWTTGACAAAGAVASLRALLSGSFPDPVTISLPRGQSPSFSLSQQKNGDGWAMAGIIKNAGDDPDITNGAEIITHLKLGNPSQGIRFLAGEGVGTVTLPGLPLGVGEPAINPGPRRIIADNLKAVAREYSTGFDLDITVSIPGGEKLALKTMNGRLGIKGGLSVLGTTGVVIPYSCASWIHSIHRGIDVARATGLNHIAAATGSTSEAALLERLDLPETALIDMGDFVGGLLKYLAKHPFERLTLAGGFAKLSKLAGGHMDLHSSRSIVDLVALADYAGTVGADEKTQESIKIANTAMEALTIAQSADVALGDAVAARARGVAMATLTGGTEVDVMIFGRTGELVGRAGEDA